MQISFNLVTKWYVYLGIRGEFDMPYIKECRNITLKTPLATDRSLRKIRRRMPGVCKSVDLHPKPILLTTSNTPVAIARTNHNYRKKEYKYPTVTYVHIKNF